jgi:hypothetical protein
VAKHLIDTDLYIDLIQSGTTLPLIREIYDKDTPGIYFSSVVAQELLVAPELLQGESAWRYYSVPSRESVEL